jgi:hypothetical protein
VAVLLDLRTSIWWCTTIQKVEPTDELAHLDYQVLYHKKAEWVGSVTGERVLLDVCKPLVGVEVQTTFQ